MTFRVDNKPRAERMAICRACPEAEQIIGALLRCRKCGCVCQFKTAILAAKCPLNKW